MRTFQQIYEDFCKWLVEKNGDDSYSYDNFKDSFIDKHTFHSFLYKSILELCYDIENGLYYFCKFIIGDLKHIGYPKPFRYDSLLRKWDKLIKNNRELCILSARGHGKTIFFSEMLNIYDMFIFQYRRIILISASQEQSIRILNEIKTIIESNEWLLQKKDEKRWAAETIGFNNGYIIAKGLGSEILGEHVDRIVLDDILQTLDASKRITDQAIEDYIDMTLSPMLLNRNGQMLIVGTPKSNADIFARIERRIKQGSTWKLEKFKAIIDYDNKILQCAHRFTWKDIMNKRLSMGPLKFAREYQLEYFSRDTSLFPLDLIKLAKDNGTDYVLLDKIDKRDPNWMFVVGVDVARSGAASADYTVAIVLAYNSITQQKQLVHFFRKKGLKIKEQARYLSDISNKFNNPCFLVEQNNVGQEMIDTLVDDYNLFVESFTTTSKSKEELIRFLITSFEHEQIIIPQGNEESRYEMDIIEDELSKFCVTLTPAGNEKFEGIGGHDDTVIALALANKATQVSGTPFAVTSFGQDTSTEMHPEYGAFIKGNRGESDLVKLIRMGVIK